jgi:hypothetical protein
MYDGYLDYVTAWFKKANDYFASGTSGRFAFVATNSISQGQPVGALFQPLLSNGWRIRFAHQSFPWDSESPGAANVHCVIVGFDRMKSPAPQLFIYPKSSTSPVQISASNVNSYLVDGPNVVIQKRSYPLAKDLPRVNFGTMPIDGGNLIVEKEEHEVFASDPIAQRFLRRYVGSKEVVQNLERWCLWLEDATSDDIRSSQLLLKRVEACRHFRENSPKGGDAFKYKDTPHLFRPNSNRPQVKYVCFPRVVSENRKYFTVAYLEPSVIASDAVFTAEDPDGLAFALASSSMFITWQKFVGGRLESRLRFSNTIVWNNFPIPEIQGKDRVEIIAAGVSILNFRSSLPSESLASLYDPLAMKPDLLKLHASLDKSVDKIFGLGESSPTNEQRLEILLGRYKQLSSPGS